MLGSETEVFYDDGNVTTDGRTDYAVITDLEVALDVIRLNGRLADYVLVENVAGLPAGTAIFLQEPGGQDELIGVIQGVTGLSLSDRIFEFVPNVAPVVDLNGAAAGANFAATYTEDAVPVAIAAPTLTVTDENSANLVSATIMLTAIPDGDSEVLSADTTGTPLTATYANGTLTLSGTASVAVYQQVLRTIAYQNTSQNPTTSDRTITVTVSDGIATSAPVVSTISIIPDDDAPTISVIADQVTDEDVATAALAFTVGDAETPAANLVVTAVSSNPDLIPDGNIVLAGTGSDRTVRLIPADNAFGTAVITLRVSDGSQETVETFQITVTPVNDRPTITAIADQVTNEDVATGAIAFTIDDLETDADDLTVTVTSSNTTLVPNGGIALTAGVNGARSLVLTPAANQFGETTITVTVSDGSLTVTETFAVVVNSVNDLPTLTPIANQAIQEDGNTGAIAFTIGDVETPVASLTVTATSNNTTLVPNSNIVITGTGSNRTIQVTPVGNRFGSAIITVTVGDGEGTTTQTFQVDVAPVNDLPTITPIANQTIDEDTSGQLTFTVGDVETPANLLNVTATSSNPTLIPNGNLVIQENGGQRTLLFTPTANQFGTATITVSVSDGVPGSPPVTTTFEVTVAPVNDLPELGAIANVTVDEDEAIVVPVTVSDLETAPASLTLTALSSSNTTLLPLGNIVVEGTGSDRTVTLTPVANRFGSSTVTLQLSDGQGGLVTRTFVLTVNSDNDLPTVSAIGDVTINQDTPSEAIAFTVSDVETAPGQISVVASSSNPGLIPVGNILLSGEDGNRTVTVTPAPGQSGSSTITLTVNDGSASVQETFVVTVSAVNTPPVANNDTLSTAGFYGSPITISTAQLLANDDDVNPLNTLTVTAVGNASNGTVSLSGSVITFRPTAGFSGNASFDYTLSDGNGGTDVGTVTVPVVTSVDLGAIASGTGLPTGLLGFAINGIDGGDRSGVSISNAGDVNNDGLDDLIIGASAADSNAGEAYVVFGKTTTTAVNLASLGTGGFLISSAGASSRTGGSVSGGGDVNNDGLDDVVLGAFAANSGTGAAYVVFGKTTATAVSPSSLGTAGFAINGITSGDRAGTSVSIMGDLNGDNRADIIVGAPNANGFAGAVYVVFGKTDTTAVNLSSLGTGGFVINGAANELAGASVSAAGDVNNDGRQDIVLGALGSTTSKAYVVFGKDTTTAVNLSSLGGLGYEISGIPTTTTSGIAVSGAGDINGDNLDDVVVGVPGVNSDAGRVYVAFGKANSTAINVGSLGTGGFVIDGLTAGGRLGAAVSRAGDVNGDGLEDLIVGAPGANSGAGASYLIFGKAGNAAVNVSSLGSNGFAITGTGAIAAGTSVSGAGDINNDGFDDLLVSAPGTNTNRGTTYVIFGGDFN